MDVTETAPNVEIWSASDSVKKTINSDVNKETYEGILKICLHYIESACLGGRFSTRVEIPFIKEATYNRLFTKHLVPLLAERIADELKCKGYTVSFVTSDFIGSAVQKDFTTHEHVTLSISW